MRPRAATRGLADRGQQGDSELLLAAGAAASADLTKGTGDLGVLPGCGGAGASSEGERDEGGDEKEGLTTEHGAPRTGECLA
jgi:hypothetical protein